MAAVFEFTFTNKIFTETSNSDESIVIVLYTCPVAAEAFVFAINYSVTF